MPTFLDQTNPARKHKLLLVLLLTLAGFLGLSILLAQAGPLLSQGISRRRPETTASFPRKPALDQAVLAYRQARAEIVESGHFTGPLPNR